MTLRTAGWFGILALFGCTPRAHPHESSLPRQRQATMEIAQRPPARLATGVPLPAGAPIVLIGAEFVRLQDDRSERAPPDDADSGFRGLMKLSAALAERPPSCACKKATVLLLVADDAPTWRIFGVLGVASRAGFAEAVIRYRDHEFPVRLVDAASPLPLVGTVRARVMLVTTRLAVVHEGSVAVDRQFSNHHPPDKPVYAAIMSRVLADYCESLACDAASLSVTEDARAVDWLGVAAGLFTQVKEPVELSLDRAARPSWPAREATAGAITPTGRIAPEVIWQRTYAEYASIAACARDQPRPRHELVLDITLGHDGLPTAVVPQPTSASPDEEWLYCVANVFRRMSFPPPSSGTARVLYPVPIE